MTITVTKITNSQWTKVGKVFLWLLLSSGLAALTAWLASNKNYLATMPAYNVIIVALSQLFQNEEAQAQSQIPVVVQPEVNQVVDAVEANEPTVPAPTPTTPPIEPVSPA